LPYGQLFIESQSGRAGFTFMLVGITKRKAVVRASGWRGFSPHTLSLGPGPLSSLVTLQRSKRGDNRVE
jgi:hypothetical protein